MYSVCVLHNPKGLLYKGQTEDLTKRIQEHNNPDGPYSYTRHRGPWTLIYKKEYATRAAAMQKEKFLKTGKGRDFLKKILK